jgi:hypothetical protein
MPSLETEYAKIVELSERVAWRVDDIMGADERLDFRRPFVPSSIAGVRSVTGLSPRERLMLNQIRGFSYVHLFAFVEEYIIATAVRHANAELFGEPWAIRALLRFGDEELKHQQLFRRFEAAFVRDFGSPCEGVGSAEEAAGFILGKSPLAVMLATLHLELVTQAHYTDSVRLGVADEELDPLFASLLKHHWIEEAQHAKIDALEIRKLAEGAPPEALDRALDDYVAILHALDGVLEQQCALDLGSFERAIGRPLDGVTRASLDRDLRAASRESYFARGLANRAFRDEVARLSPSSLKRLDQLTADLRA